MKRSHSTRVGGATKAIVALVVAILLPGMLLVVPALAGEAGNSAEWRLSPWNLASLATGLPQPGSDLPAPGTILPGASSDGSRQAAPSRPPEASLLADPAAQAGRQLQEGLTPAQRAALAQVLAQNKQQLANSADRAPRPQTALPAAQARPDQIVANAPRLPDPAAMKAADAEIRAAMARTNAAIAANLTPEQRALFERSLPSSVAPVQQQVSSVPPDVTSSNVADVTSSKGAEKDDTDKEARLTRTERQQRERTNRAGLDDYHTEGNVAAVRCSDTQAVPDAVADPVPFNVNETPYAVIATRDGLQQVRLYADTAQLCGSIKVGEYLVVDGVKQSESVFDAEKLDSEPSVVR